MERQKAKKPKNQPFVDALYDLMEAKSFTSQAEFRQAVFGDDFQRHSGIVSNCLAGQVGVGLKFARRIADALDEPAFLERIMAIRSGDKPVKALTPVRAEGARPKALTPVRAVVAAHAAVAANGNGHAAPAPKREAAVPAGAPMFALIIDQNGRTRLSLNLYDVGTEDAVSVFNLLASANLLKGRSDDGPL